MSKLNKYLITINGFLIPFILLFLFSMVIMEKLSHPRYNSEPVSEGVNLNNVSVDKSGDTIITQGITYQKPKPIYNSTNYIIAISPKIYEQPEVRRNECYSLKDIVLSNENADCYLNFIFLDKTYKCIGRLVNNKASIKEYLIHENYNEKVDTTVKNIAYLISFTDTNNDGLLNGLDKHDLYISDLNGFDLTKVTSNINIVDFEFVHSNSELFITYKDNTSKREEYKLNKFAVYNIKNRQLRFLRDVEKSINAVTDILYKK